MPPAGSQILADPRSRSLRQVSEDQRFSPARREKDFTRLRPDVVVADFAVERGRVHSQKLGGAGLVAAGYFKRAPDQLDLEAVYFIIEGYSPRQVDLSCDFLPAYLRDCALRIQNFFAKVLALNSLAASDDHRAFHDVFKLAHVSLPIVGFKSRQDRSADLVRDLPIVLRGVFSNEMLRQR